ncbi:MAG: translocation/assembly module TamB [Deltaproteobacteria bacterium]|jgi:autotransporter translocation and assembly factor TamB|nr:translocation/assembly module TamB [Deltaproteobacteria bacterium]
MAPKTVELKKKSPEKRGLISRLLKWLAMAAALLIAVLAACALYLRSDSGLSLIASEASKLLGSSGLILEWDSVSGPLPERLAVTGLRLSDQKGLFLALDSLELDLAPGDLLKRLINAESLKISGLDFKRLPSLPPSEDKGGGLALPPDLGLVANLEIDDSRVSPAVLLALSGPGASESGAGEAGAFQGDPYGPERGRLKAIASLEYRSSALSFDFDAQWADKALYAETGEPLGSSEAQEDDNAEEGPLKAPPDQGSFDKALDSGKISAEATPPQIGRSPQALFHGFSARGSLKRGAFGSPDELVLAAVARDGPGGTLSLLLGQPDWPAWTLSLSGQGPMSGWVGEASLGLDDDAGDSGIAKARLSVKLPSGSIENDLIKSLRGSISLEADGGPQTPLPAAVKARLGSGLTLSADVELNESSLTGRLSFLSPNARLALKDLSADLGGGEVKISAKGSLALDPEVVAPKTERAAKKPWPANPPLPPVGPPRNPPLSPAVGAPILKGAPAPEEAMEAEASLPPGADEDAGGSPDRAGFEERPGPESGPSGGPRPLQGPQALFLSADFQTSLSLKGQAFELEKLAIAGEALDLEGSGKTDGEAASASAQIALGAGSRWLDLLGLPHREPKGAARVKAEFGRSDLGEITLVAKLDLDEIGVFSPWRGKLSGTIQAKGQIDDLKVETDLSSPALIGPNGRRFGDFKAIMSLSAKEIAASPRLFGEARANLQDPDGGPIELSGGLSLSAGPPLVLSAERLALTADGGKRLDLESRAFSLKLSDPPEIEGDLSLSVTDWKTVSELTGLDISGEPASLSLEVSPSAQASQDASPGSAEESKGLIGSSKASASLSLPRLSLMGSLFTDVKLSAKAANYPADPDLDIDLSMGPGSAGSIEFGRGTLKASGRAGDGRFSLAFSQPGGGELIAASGDLDLKSERIYLESLRAAPPQIPGALVLNKPVALSLSPLSFDDLSLNLGSATIAAALNDAPLRADVDIQGLDLSIFKSFSESVPKGVASLKASYEIGGKGAVDLKAKVATPAAIEGLPSEIEVSAVGSLGAGGRELQGTVTLAQDKGRQISLDYKLPMRPAGDWVAPDLEGPMRARLAWKGPVTPLWSLLNLADRKLTGTLDLDASVEGPLKALRPVAKIYLAGGAYEDLVLGLSLTGINLELTDDVNELKLIAEALDGKGGRLALEGAVKPFDSPPTIHLRGQIKNLAPLHRDDADLTFSALTSIEGPLASPVISAKAVIAQAEVNLDMAKSGRAAVKTLPIASEAAPVGRGPSLDVAVDIPRQVFIRGKGLDSEWAGSLRVTGRATMPLISGSLHPVRGSFELLSKQFTLSGGDIQFINSPSLNPILNLEMTRETSDLTAQVKVSGQVSQPKIDFTSQPPHPSDEVLSQVLFGKNVSQLSRVEALQLANSIRVMAGLGGPIGMDILNNLRATLGLSVLRVGESGGGQSSRYLGANSFRENLGLDSDDDAQAQDSATIEAGRYLSDNVYVGVEQNLGDNTTGVRVEVELTPSITLQGLSSSKSSRVGLGWKRDY